MRRLGFVTWSNTSPTGGNVYNEELVAALRDAGVEVAVRRLEGPWPAGSPPAHRELAEALAAEPVTLVDGVVASGAPEVIEAAPTWVAILVHMAIADEVGLDAVTHRAYAAAERRSLHHAARVIAPSAHAGERLALLYGLQRVDIARPGVHPAPLASGSAPPRLLCLGALTPTKNQLALLGALQQIGHLSWTARIVGSPDARPDYASAVRSAAMQLGQRVALPGVLTGAALDAEWDATDLLVHCALSETYGLVVSEALARGIPALVRAGTGAVEALGRPTPGRSIGERELASSLATWLTDAGLRSEWREAARVRRLALPGWDQTARQVLAALGRGGS